jgi:hypothetical protein
MLNDLKDELRRPTTTITIVIAIISIIIGTATSLYFYQRSVKVGAFYYKVVQILAFDQTNLKEKAAGSEIPVSIVDGTGKKIKGNIYVANIEIWNGGSDEIRKEDVRSPFKLSLSGDVRVLDVTTYGQTNGNSDQFEINGDNNIEWNHFDPGDGFIIRLVYASDEEQKISIMGRAANSGEPKDVAEIKEKYDKIPSYAETIFYFVFASVIVVGILSGLVAAYIGIVQRAATDKTTVAQATIKSLIDVIKGKIIWKLTAQWTLIAIIVTLIFLFKFDKFWAIIGVIPASPF